MSYEGKEKIRAQIFKLVEKYFSLKEDKFIPGETPIPTMGVPFDHEEVNEVIDTLLSTKVTMGSKVEEFEKSFANWVGTKYGVMTNSGSSANLLCLSALTNPLYKNKLTKGCEIITPAFTWATTLYPIADLNLLPVLVDVDLETFNVDPDAIEEAITKKTKALFIPHLVGIPCEMDKIVKIAEKHNLLLIEDACEAHGAEYDGKKVGTFGLASTYSFFYSHHITTVEGGMVLTDDGELSELMKAMRAFGWIRNLKKKEEIAKAHPEIDPRVLFITRGYNIRPTEMQAAFGIRQLKKLDKVIEIKRKIAEDLSRRLEPYKEYLIVPKERPRTKYTWFVYPLIVRETAPFTRNELTNYLEQKKIETRLIAAGNMAEQPVIKQIEHKIVGELRNARLLHRNSFFIGCHAGIQKPQIEYIAKTFEEFINSRVKR
jgi:CDP-6-deoxy-D-xylo-4-hexulose-3-dehydrase